MREEEMIKSIQWQKKEINVNGWNAFELRAEELMKASGGKDQEAWIHAMKMCMLEGDRILSDDPESFAVCYYCDNLSESRRRVYFE